MVRGTRLDLSKNALFRDIGGRLPYRGWHLLGGRLARRLGSRYWSKQAVVLTRAIVVLHAVGRVPQARAPKRCPSPAASSPRPQRIPPPHRAAWPLPFSTEAKMLDGMISDLCPGLLRALGGASIVEAPFVGDPHPCLVALRTSASMLRHIASVSAHRGESMVRIESCAVVVGASGRRPCGACNRPSSGRTFADVSVATHIGMDSGLEGWQGWRHCVSASLYGSALWFQRVRGGLCAYG